MDLLYTKDAGLDLVMGGGYDGNPYIEDQQIKNKMSTGFRGLTKIKKRTVDYDDINSVWGFAFTYGMLWLINKFTPVALSKEEELTGLDKVLHGETAYTDDF